MPRGDKTGPMGMGRRTGRGAGYCSGENRPGYATAGFGFRCGLGLGRRRGFRGGAAGRGFGAWIDRPGESAWERGQPSGIDAAPYGRPEPEMEKRLLERQAEDLQMQLDAVRKQIGAIDVAPASS